MSDIDRDVRHLQAAIHNESIIFSRLRQDLPLDEIKIYLAISDYNQDEIGRHTKKLQNLGLSQEQIDSAVFASNNNW